MGYINTDQCDCCKEIWNRVNLHHIPLQSITLIMCDDCLSEFKNCFIDKHKIDKAIEEIRNLKIDSVDDDFYDCKYEVLEILKNNIGK